MIPGFGVTGIAGIICIIMALVMAGIDEFSFEFMGCLLYTSQPYSRMYSVYPDALPDTEITLIPYGCTTLRITEFPIIRK